MEAGFGRRELRRLLTVTGQLVTLHMVTKVHAQ
jgi:hypothetical protein